VIFFSVRWFFTCHTFDRDLHLPQDKPKEEVVLVSFLMVENSVLVGDGSEVSLEKGHVEVVLAIECRDFTNGSEVERLDLSGHDCLEGLFYAQAILRSQVFSAHNDLQGSGGIANLNFSLKRSNHPLYSIIA